MDRWRTMHTGDLQRELCKVILLIEMVTDEHNRKSRERGKTRNRYEAAQARYASKKERNG